MIIYGIDLVQQLWAGLVPLVFFLLFKYDKARTLELLNKALVVYVLAWLTYEIVRLVALPHTRDNWLVLGVKVFFVFVLMEMAWSTIHPAVEDEIPSSLVKVLYAVGALAGFIGVVLSFLGRA